MHTPADHRTFMSEVALLDGTASVPLLTEVRDCAQAALLREHVTSLQVYCGWPTNWINHLILHYSMFLSQYTDPLCEGGATCLADPQGTGS